MVDKYYNDVKSYLIGLQQSIKIIDNDPKELSLIIERLQCGNAELSQEISSYLKGLRDGLIWYNDNHVEGKGDNRLFHCSVVINQILGSCFD